MKHKPPLPLYPYQQRWLADSSRFKLWVKSVQIGASFAQCVEAVMDCAQRAQLWILLSASERQALELARTCKRICQAGRVVAELRENQFFAETQINQHSIEFPNGARIIALPANPDTARGYAGNVVLDEFAIHREATEIWRAAFGRASRGFSIRVISSPKGQRGKFYELAKNIGLDHQPANPQSATQTPESPWSGHWTDIFLAESEGCPVKMAELRAGCGDEETWNQEYCCVFLSDSENFIPLELIAGCESADATLDFDPSIVASSTPRGLSPAIPRGDFFFGFDVGRKRDLSVLMVGEKLGDVVWVRKLLEMSKTTFSVQKQAIRDAAVYCTRGCIDASGLGMQMAEEMAAELPGRVEPVDFTMPVKQDLAFHVKAAFEERRIRIPDYRPLRVDINAVKKIITAAGNLRFDAERTEQGHSDRFWALALMLHAASTGVAAASLGVDAPQRRRPWEPGAGAPSDERRPSFWDMDRNPFPEELFA